LEDFTYLVYVDNHPPIHFREIRPKDFYFAQVLRNKEENPLKLIERLVFNLDDLLDLPVTPTKRIFDWVSEELLNEKIMTVENWLRAAYHMSKQRWGESLDWLESQPISKVLLMVDIIKEYNEEVEDQMKKSRKK